MAVFDQIVGLINPGMSLVFAGGGLALWLRERQLRYILGYVLAALLLGTSFAINHYSPDPGHRLVQMAAAALSISSVIALVASMCRRLGQPVPLRLWAGAGLVAVVLVGLADHRRDVSVSLLAVNLCCGLVMVMGTQIMAQARSHQLVDRLLVWIFAIVAAQFFLRPIGVLMLGGPMSTAAYRDSAGHAVLVLTAAILTLVLTAAILAATISDQIRAVRQAVRKDELSGLLRRDSFDAEARDLIARARAKGRAVSMVIADIDHFKQINDALGHPAGDAVIRAFGSIMAASIRPCDLAGRIGGEEFGLIAWDCPEAPAGHLAERLRAALAARPVEALGAQIALTASFGVATLRPGEAYGDLYARADNALYQAKRAGRDRVVVAGALPAASLATSAPLPAEKEAGRSAGSEAGGLGIGGTIARRA
jgi:diguanylate cyclase (GGDEF)-like protein